MGALDHISEAFDFSHSSSSSIKRLKKHKQLQTVEIKVRMDREGCERKVKKSVDGMKGVNQVDVDPKKNKLAVTGYVDPKKVLHRVQLLQYRTGKRAEFWPYIPYEMVAHPYALGAYDKKAPSGYVCNVLVDTQSSKLAHASSFEEKYVSAFSDDNPNACSVM